jgi:ABC-2 type transport system ATP-binding protein
MRRRLDIAIGLLTTPEVIFLDEPTTGLDPRSRRNMWHLIQQLADRGVTIFLTTQYLEEADQLADKIAIIDDGRIVKEGTAEELKKMTGEEKLELIFTDRNTLQNAQTLLNGIINQTERSISLPFESTENVRQLLNSLHEIDIAPEAMNFRKPSLDDVFMEITGGKQKEVLAHG